MNAYRKFGRILAVTALTCMAAAVTPAFADSGHGGGGGHGGGSAHAGGGGHSHFAAGGRAGGARFAPGFRGGAFYGARGGYYGRGGYWHGGFYGTRFGFGWFLPVLPAFYATYWWGGVPYYYANDAYYTWSPDYNGYVATDPPAGAAGAAGAPASDNNPNNGAPPPAGGGQMNNYPKNGQTDEQQASDRYQCHQWAVSQSGYDPTRNAAPTAAGQQVDYQRAVTACMEGRGYSVR